MYEVAMDSSIVDPVFGISWQEIHVLWLICSGLLIAVTFMGMRWHRLYRWLQTSTGQAAQKISLLQQTMKTVLFIAATLLLGVALLRPAWGYREENRQQKVRDVMVALDISRSMLAQDYEPSRLVFAKQKINQLLGQLHAARVGLVIFSGEAILQCPLTRDKNAFQMCLDELEVEKMGSGTTSFTAALSRVLEAFRGYKTNAHKLVILCTDGEDFSDGLDALYEKLKKEKISLFTLGIADPVGAPIPLYDENGKKRGHQKDRQGRTVLSRLNSTVLSELARVTGGKYLHARRDEQDIRTIVNWVEAFEKHELGKHRYDALHERYHYYALAAWVLYLLEWVI